MTPPDHRSPGHPDVLQREFASPDAQVDALRAEVVRLRDRTHEIQAEEDRKRADLESQLAHHRRCRRIAEDAVAEVAADWAGTTPGTFWQYSSQNTRDALTGLVEEIDRLRHGLPSPDSIRYGIEAEPWEGNGPCMDCQGRSPYWHALNDVWDAVMANEHSEASGATPGGVICPTCFVIRAWQKGIEGWDAQWWWGPGPATSINAIPEADWLRLYDEINGLRDALRAGWSWGQYEWAQAHPDEAS